jgi:hypothetical protein
MTRFNWDRVRKENAVRQHGSEPIFAEQPSARRKEKSQQRSKQRRLIRCPHCPALVNEDNLTRHLRKVHGIPGNLERPIERSSSQPLPSPTRHPPQITLAMLADELRPRFNDLIVNLVRREGAYVSSFDSSVTRAVADKVRVYFRRRTTI